MRRGAAIATAIGGGVLCGAAGLTALAFLWRLRPERPDFPGSLSSPVTTAMLQQLGFVAVWLLGAVVVLLVLARSLHLVLARSRREPPRRLPDGGVGIAQNRALGQTRSAPGPRERAFSPPFPLVPRARSACNCHVELASVPAREGIPARALPGELREAQAAKHRDRKRAPSIALLGPLEIAASKPRRRGLRSQTQQLLAYLALHREGATLDELVAAFLPDVEDDKARQRLWEWVSDARRHLSESIFRENERYLLDREAVAVDLDEFEELLSRARAERGLAREQQLERALVLVRGQPLAGTDFAWAASDVRRLHATIVDLLKELGHIRLDNGNPTGALAAAEQAIAFDAYNEPAHQVAMHAEAALGLRQAIDLRYEWLCRELDARFGLEPEHETRLLYRRLLSQDARVAMRHP